MKMDWSHDELLALAEDAEEILKNKLEALITQYEGALTLEQMLSVRNETFYSAFRSFVQTIEEGDYSYDYEQVGRFSHLLYQQLESVWLEYVR